MMALRSLRSGQGSNSVQVRQFNERIVLQALRGLGEASKADLARIAGLTNNAIGDIIRDLITMGLVAEIGKRREGQRGQPATMLALVPEGAYSIGVRLDRVATEVFCVDFSGRVVDQRLHDIVLPSPEDLLPMVVADIASILDGNPEEVRRRLAGIGLGQPFHLGSWLRELELPASTFKRWDEYDFATALARETGLPVFSENDGNAAAIAELFYGRGRDTDDFLYVFIGGAVGGGVVLAGDCLHGTTGNAGDVAMLPVPGSTLASAPTPERAFDVLLTRASLTSLKRHLRWSGERAESIADLGAVLRRDPRPAAVDEWVEDAVAALVPAVMAATAVLDVPHVVIDSDLQGLATEIVERLTRSAAAALPESVGAPIFLTGSFGPAAGAIGAATLPLFFNFSPRPTILTGAADPAAAPREPEIGRVLETD
jgi:predicted NBD/HSP70 family sugar kinase